jgi:ATP-binding cassette subfamily C protein LapB
LQNESNARNPLTRTFRIGLPELIVSTLMINILALALPMLTLQVYDRIIPHPESGTLPVLIGGVCVAVCLDTVLRLARARMLGWNGTCYDHALSCSAVDHLLNTDLAAYGGVGTGEHLSRLAAVSRLKDFNNGFVTVTLLELAFLPVFLWLIAVIAGPLVAIPAAVLGLFILSSIVNGYRLKNTLAARDEADDGRYNFLIEALEGIHTLKSFSLEDRFLRRYENLEDVSTVANFKVTEASARIFNASTVFSHAMTAAVITCGALYVLAGHMTSGSLIATVLLSGRIMLPVQRVLGLWARYQDYRIARGKAEQIFALPLEKNAAPPVEEPGREGRIELRDAGFRYDGDGPFLFRHVNLSLARGESVCITGAHGAGKSVLLHILAGLYAPSEGEAALDGVSPMAYSADRRLHHIGLMTTKSVIFRGTIRENITRFGLAPEAEAREISHLLGIDREVSALPRGFDTFLEGTETDSIPPGLRQRIALARVLASKPRVLLFDNADRNLDREGYRQVYRLLGRLREKTALVLVTDDRNLARLADRHYLLTPEGLHPVRDFHENVMYGRLHA